MLKPTHFSSVSTLNVLAITEKNKRPTSPKNCIGLHTTRKGIWPFSHYRISSKHNHLKLTCIYYQILRICFERCTFIEKGFTSSQF